MKNCFVSVLGPNQPPPKDEDVCFIKMVGPDFDAARAAKTEIEEGYSLVVYRLSYDQANPDGPFYSSRQDDLSATGKGLERKNDKEPPGLPTLGYELYSAADELRNSPNLGAMIGKIRSFSHQPKPGKGLP